MATSHERFEEEIRPLALLMRDQPRPAEPPRRPRPWRVVTPVGFVESWSWWRRTGQGAARP